MSMEPEQIAEIAEGRTPESLTRLEKTWLNRRFCAWCEAPLGTNACYAMVDCTQPDLPPRCTEEEMNQRRAKFLRDDYKPRKHLQSAQMEAATEKGV